MKLSWRWLSELVDLAGVDPAEAARALTFKSAEVEGLERLGTGLDGVVTARVDRVVPHPNADRLRLCTVSTGAGAPVEVVCGALNVAEGQIVCFARVGLTLPGGLTLKKAKIRGVESEGMICAEDELGLGTNHDGIIVLPPGTPVGVPVSGPLGVGDAVLEVGNTAITNRPDLWGHVGFARELSAILSRPLRPPPTAKAEASLSAARAPALPVTIEDPAACRRYVGLVVEGVRNGRTPPALVRRLEALGLRSVDLLVDLTNLVMLETGQPLHAFDLREIRGGAVHVRSARPGEAFETLDGKALSLVSDDLVIADAERVLALAGVLGGKASGVRADTTAILVESACFEAARTRRASIRHGTRTDASARFEKSLDPAGALPAALRYVELLLEHVPTAHVARAAADAHPRPFTPRSIDLAPDLVSRRLGIDVPVETSVRHLTALGFGVERAGAVLRVSVPSWRATKDVVLPEDLVEEVGRIHGYEHVKPIPLVGPLLPARPDPLRALERRGKTLLSLDLGYAEIASYVFHGLKECERTKIDPEACLRLRNPLSAEQDRLQVTTAQNLLRALVRNQAGTGQPGMGVRRLHEWTRVVRKADRRTPERATEIPVVGLGVAERERLDDAKGEVFLAAKEDVLALLARLGVTGAAASDAGDARLDDLGPLPAWLHPGRRAAVRHGGVVLALVGEVLPAVARAWDLAGTAALGEIHLDRVLAAVAAAPATMYRPPPRFPFAPFDVAVIVDRKTPAALVADELRRSAPKAVRGVTLFDAYEGPGIPAGQRSLAFTVTFGDDDATLSPKTIEVLQARAIDALRKKGYTVRTADAPKK